MGFWHTSYIEFHEFSGFPETTREPEKLKFPCSICQQDFDTLSELEDHRFEKHPIIKPALFINNQQIGKSEVLITSINQLENLKTLNANKCTLNGINIQPAIIKNEILKYNDNKLFLTLHNDNSSESYEIMLQIANEIDIVGIENLFDSFSKRRTLTITSISNFIDEAKKFKTATNYLDGICQYLYGVIAKENLDKSHHKYNDYTELFEKSQNELKYYDRPIANFIRGIIAFNFNQFDYAKKILPNGRLNYACIKLTYILNNKELDSIYQIHDDQSSHLEEKLCDLETIFILRNLTKSNNFDNLLTFKSRMKSIKSDYDKIKLTILNILTQIEFGKTDDAVTLARSIEGLDLTSSWANSIITRYAK